jgi:NAD(P)-dependent dehydrogenase (short-subunit alcohol dehydrogenase family)
VNLNKIFDLSDKVIVVTGGCGLLGRKHCEAIAESGGIPVILDLDGRRAEKLGEEISNTFLVDAAGYKVDVSKEEQVAENSKELIRRYGKIDCLVNNAANNSHITKKEKRNFSRLENFSFNEWETDIAVGLTGAFLCSKYYGFRISENPEGGVILNISSDLGLLAPDQRLYRDKTLSENEQPTKPVSYSVVKSGLIGLTK